VQALSGVVQAPAHHDETVLAQAQETVTHGPWREPGEDDELGMGPGTGGEDAK